MKTARMPAAVTLSIEVARSALGQITQPNLGRMWRHFDWERSLNATGLQWSMELTVWLQGVEGSVGVVVGSHTPCKLDNAILSCCVSHEHKGDGPDAWDFAVLVAEGTITAIQERIYSDDELIQLAARQEEILRHERFAAFARAEPNLAGLLIHEKITQIGPLYVGRYSLIAAAVAEFDRFLRQ